MKEIKLYVLHPYCKDVNSTLNYLQLKPLRDSYNFIWEPNCPDYLITTEHIYNSPKYRKAYKKVHRKEQITVFFTREAVSPDFNLCDYAIGFDANLKNEDRFCQLPSAFDLFPAFMPVKKNELNTIDDAIDLLQTKTGFCNFLYSNHMAHPNRDKLFYILSEYKIVDSLGRHLNNVPQKGTGYVGHENSCVDMKSGYKFSIASENASFPGYTSEKILTSLAAHTVPIYFGDPNVEDIINPECFINCNKLDRIEDVIDLVMEVDNDEEKWAKMVSAPWQTKKQKEISEQRGKAYLDFFNQIFAKDLKSAKRRPEGMRPDMYSYQFFKEKVHTVPIVVLVYRRIVKSYVMKWLKK